MLIEPFLHSRTVGHRGERRFANMAGPRPTPLDRRSASSKSAHFDLALSIFKKHDKDGSGALDRTEATTLIDDFCKTLNLDLAAREKETLLNEQFVAADANGDGTLCWEEFHALAAYLDTIASALGGSVDAEGDTESVRVEMGTGCAATTPSPPPPEKTLGISSSACPSLLPCVLVGRAGTGGCWTRVEVRIWCVTSLAL